MSALTLYKLAAEYKHDADKLADLDLDEQTLADTLESLGGELTTKAVNVAYVIKNIDHVIAGVNDAIEQLRKRSVALQNRKERVQVYLKTCMESVHISKLESDYLTLTIKSNPPKVVIFDESQIPAEYLRTPEPPTPSPDKKAIKVAIDAGKEVAGATLETTTRLEIK